ncbi:hypothetical protein [Rodentibacter caecimuris]|uniref:Phage tail protein n=1 Tax=Rodentibacter caecimuris TaxID=1796644 RepID=A0ABX3KWB1_9PAST|nr:hypothetical protein BKG89_08010 [Rodentibacter heylii]
MTLGTRESLLRENKPKLKKVMLGEKEYFIREMTVGEVNQHLYGYQALLCQLAEEQGITLDYNDPEELGKQLSRIYDPYRTARQLAIRLCDENGVNLFDPENKEDLEALSHLDKSVSETLSKVLLEEEPKNLMTDASSK